MNRHYAGPGKLPAETAAYYSYERSRPEATETLLEEKKTYRVKRVTLPASKASSPGDTAVKQDTIVLDYYEIKGGGKTPVVIVLPVLGGNNNESELFCSYFAEHGYASLIVHRDRKQKEFVNLQNIEWSLRDMVVDNKIVIDWLMTRNEIDADRIGVFGASMGGIKASLLLSLDPRIKAGVIALAGGDLPYMFWNSKEKGIIERIDALMRKSKLSREELYGILRNKIKTDPLPLAPYMDARNILLVQPVFDKIVPYRKQRELGKAIGGPERIHLLAGHYTSIAYIYYVRRASLRFFEKKFGGHPKN